MTPPKDMTEREIKKCEMCGDNDQPIFLHARCHLTAPLKASIENGILNLRCYVPDCLRVVAKFKIDRIENDTL